MARRGVGEGRGPAQAEAARHGTAGHRRGRPRPPLWWAGAVRKVVGRCCAVGARGGPRAVGRRGGVGRVEARRVGGTGLPAVAHLAVRRGRVAAAWRGRVAAARKRASGEEATAAWRGEARVEA